MSGSWLLLRSSGLLWAVANARVRQVERSGSGMLVHVGDEILAGDDVAAVQAAVTIAPDRPLLRRLLPGGSVGVAVWRDEPLLVVNPDHPPEPLRHAHEEEEP